MLFDTSDIQENIRTISHSLERLYDITEGLDDLHVFTSGRGVFHGRQVIQDRIGAIRDLHEKAHAFYAELGDSLEETKKMRKLVELLFGGESFFASLTQGQLSRENLVRSLLAWKIDEP
jgi:hypothetical protein